MPKTIDHNKRRKDIIDNSFQLFAELGYAGLSMRKMAKHMGMTTGMLYHYFANKEELFTALLMDKQIAQIATFNEYAAESDNNRTAFRQFLVENSQSMQQLLAIALEFHRQHPEWDFDIISKVYEQAFQQYLNTSELESKQLLVCLLGELVRGLLGEIVFEEWSPVFQYL